MHVCKYCSKHQVRTEHDWRNSLWSFERWPEARGRTWHACVREYRRAGEGEGGGGAGRGGAGRGSCVFNHVRAHAHTHTHARARKHARLLLPPVLPCMLRKTSAQMALSLSMHGPGIGVCLLFAVAFGIVRDTMVGMQLHAVVFSRRCKRDALLLLLPKPKSWHALLHGHATSYCCPNGYWPCTRTIMQHMTVTFLLRSTIMRLDNVASTLVSGWLVVFIASRSTT